jgi:predicted nucleotidyltransferase
MDRALVERLALLSQEGSGIAFFAVPRGEVPKQHTVEVRKGNLRSRDPIGPRCPPDSGGRDAPLKGSKIQTDANVTPGIPSIMRSPFLRSADPKFVSREEILGIACTTATRIAARHPEVLRVVLFGSFARGDYSTRSDLDLLVILKYSDLPIRDRIAEFLRECDAYPTDVFPLTEEELQARLREGDPFWTRALQEGIDCLLG